MIAWVYLSIAIACEVVAALSLRMAVSSRTAWYGLVATGYVVAFVLLSLSLSAGCRFLSPTASGRQPGSR